MVKKQETSLVRDGRAARGSDEKLILLPQIKSAC